MSGLGIPRWKETIWKDLPPFQGRVATLQLLQVTRSGIITLVQAPPKYHSTPLLVLLHNSNPSLPVMSESPPPHAPCSLHQVIASDLRIHKTTMHINSYFKREWVFILLFKVEGLEKEGGC